MEDTHFFACSGLGWRCRNKGHINNWAADEPGAHLLTSPLRSSGLQSKLSSTFQLIDRRQGRTDASFDCWCHDGCSLCDAMRGSAEEVLYKEWKRRRPAERMFDWSECAEQRRNELQKLSGNATDTNQHGGMKPDSPIQRGLDALLGCGQMIPLNSFTTLHTPRTRGFDSNKRSDL